MSVLEEYDGIPDLSKAAKARKKDRDIRWRKAFAKRQLWPDSKFDEEEELLKAQVAEMLRARDEGMRDAA